MGPSSRVLILATEVTPLRCPRQAPWGWNVSVDEVLWHRALDQVATWLRANEAATPAPFEA